MSIGNWCTRALAVGLASALLSPIAVSADEVEGVAAPTAPAPDVEPTTERRAYEGIEEITVTARKREESLQRTPVSVTAFGMDDLKELQVTRIDDLQEAVPNLQLSQGYDGGYVRATIRGIGVDDPIVTRDPSVGFYVDGVYLARAYGALIAVADVERIEVLRGPQGTLFGKNTTGGAINIVSAKPHDEFDARAQFRYGNYRNVETRASVNIPLMAERAFLRVSFASQTRDELTENVGPLFGIEPNQGGRFPRTKDADDRKMLSLRASLRLLPTDTLEVMLIGDQSRVHQRSRGAQCRYNASGETGRGESVGGTQLTSLTTGNYPFLAGLFGFVPNDGGMNKFADYRKNCELSGTLDTHDFMSNVTARNNTDTWGLTGIVTWNVTEDVTLKYTTGWRRYNHDQENEYDWTATAEFGHCFFRDEEHDAVSHELNAGGAAFDSRLSWTGGLYAFREQVNPHAGILCRVAQTLTDSWWDNGFNIVVPDANLGSEAPFLIGSDFEGATYTDLGCLSGVVCNVIPAPFALAPGAGEGINRNLFGFIESNWIVNNTYAAYFQASYDLTEKLTLTGGGRRLVEKREWKHRQQTPGELGAPDAFTNLIVNAKERFDKWTMMVNAQYQFTNDVMGFAQFSTGYKGGGFNGRVNETLPQTLTAFDPEKVDSYEVGLKSTWFDRRLRVNLGLFYTEYEDIQQTVLASASDGSFASVVENAGEAIIRGAELEIRGRPIPGLDLTAGFGWTDADYHEQFEFNNDGVLVNNRDEEFYNTPQFTMNLAAAYTFETGVGAITPRVSWYHQSEVNFSPEVKHLTRQDTYGLLNARLGWNLNDGKTEIALWGRNLLEREYSDDAISFDSGFAIADIFYGPPRLYGIEIIRQF